MDVVHGYMPELGGFESYSYTRINGAMVDAKRRLSAVHGLGRHARDKLIDAASQKGSSERLHEIATRTRASLYLLQFIVRIDDGYWISAEPQSIDTKIDPNNSHASIGDMIGSGFSIEDTVIGAEDPRVTIIFSEYTKLPERTQKILEMYFGLNGEDPMVQEEIAKVFDITASRVSQIVKHALVDLHQSYNAQTS